MVRPGQTGMIDHYLIILESIGDTKPSGGGGGVECGGVVSLHVVAPSNGRKYRNNNSLEPHDD